MKINILKDLIIIYTDNNINILNKNSIILCYLINYFNSSNNFVYLITKFNITNNNFLRNIVFLNLLKINYCDTIFNVKYEMEILSNTNNIKSIIIDDNDFLNYIDENWKLCEKIIINGKNISIDNILKLNNKFEKILIEDDKKKYIFASIGIPEIKITNIKDKMAKYDFYLEKRVDNDIRLIYVGILKESENIIEIIEYFRNINMKNPNIKLKIIYSYIEGSSNFINDVNKIINSKIEGLTFMNNLSHKETCFEIASSDIGICLEKNNFKSITYIEYELYGLEICNNINEMNLLINNSITVVVNCKKIGYHYNVLENFKNLTNNNLNSKNELIICISNDKLCPNRYKKFFDDNKINSIIFYLIDNNQNILKELVRKSNNDIIYFINEENIYLNELVLNSYYVIKKRFELLISNKKKIYVPNENKYFMDDFNTSIDFNESLLILNKKELSNEILLSQSLLDSKIKFMDLSKYFLTIKHDFSDLNKCDNDINNNDVFNNLMGSYTLYDILIQSKNNEEIISKILKKNDNIKINDIKIKKLKIIGIFDEFLYNSYKNVFDITLCDYNFLIDANKKYDFFFCESCWNGNNGKWKCKINLKKINKYLLNIINQCKKLNIKTIFYNKEDPLNFNSFIETAKYFDIVITTDENSIESYKKFNLLNVYMMPFTINPLQINNIGRKNDNNNSFFAGSYTYSLSDIRKKNTEILCDKLLCKDNFIIFDRYYNFDTIKNFYGNKFSLNIFPGKYNKYIHKSLSHDEILQVHKIYNWCGNLNTIQNSSTMFARRVIEASICKNSILTDYSKGVYENFSDSIYKLDDDIMIGSNKDILINQIKKQKGWRNVIENYNTFNHFAKIFKQIEINNFENPFDDDTKPLISVICSTNRIKNYKFILENYHRQNYKNKELIIIFNINMCDELENIISELLLKNIIVKQFDEIVSLGYCLNYGVEISSGEIISKFDDDDFYGSNYLTDMHYSMIISKADLVGKCAVFAYSLEKKEFWIKSYYKNYENYTYQANKINFISGPTLFFKKNIFSLCKFKDLSIGEDSDFIKNVKNSKYTIYASDFFNYCQIRTNMNFHTWKCEWRKYLGKKSLFIDKFNELPVNLIDV